MKKNRIPIIAEIGINHNGSIENAIKLIDMATFAGCDAVKFQKRTPELCVPKDLKNSVRETPWGNIKYIDYRKKIELESKEYNIIDQYCKEKKITWFASAWDVDSQIFLNKYKLRYNKIASAMLTYEPLLHEVAKTKKHTFISTGMSTISDIKKAINIFKQYNCPFELMYTVSKYPCPPDLIDLNCIKTFRNMFSCEVGYSGHESSAANISLGAVALGASSIERHITLDRTLFGSDQSASLEIMGLLTLVRGIRSLEKCLGNGKRKISADEKNEINRLRWFK